MTNRDFKFTKLSVEPWGQADLRSDIRSKEDFLEIMSSVWDEYVSSGYGEDSFETDEEFENDPNHWTLHVSTRPEPRV